MATWYINADTGNDTTGDGSSGTPWLTISKAHTEATTGDTVICQDSTAVYAWASQTFTKALTIQGEQTDASGAVFDASSGNIGWASTSINLTLEKLTFKDSGRTGGNSVFGQQGTSTFTYTNCRFIDLGTTGIDAGVPIGGGLFGNNQYASGGTATVAMTNCVIDDPYNTHASNKSAIFSWRNCSVGLTLNNLTIHNSVTAGNGCTDYIFGGYVTSYTVTYNNCILNNTTGSTLAQVAGSSYTYTTTLNNCDLYDIGAGGTQNNCITSDPLLIDVDNDNFNLRPTSPCIDTGILL